MAQRALIVVLVLGFSPTNVTSAQSVPSRFEAGVQITSTRSGQFDTADLGIGGRVAWRPTDLLGIEGELTLYPRDFPDRRPFSRRRVEALFGPTVAAQVGRLQPMARIRPGFVSVQEAPAPLACIRIFPPPLACELASGRTLLALDIGGGVEISAGRQTFVRIDVGDLLLRYPGPVFDSNRVIRRERFFSHGFRLAAGAGVRF
jgi:hypothetical protein